jgi:AraC-like DNA-binding protein
MSIFSEALKDVCLGGIAIGLFAGFRLLRLRGDEAKADRLLSFLILLCTANIVHGFVELHPHSQGPLILEPFQFLLPLGIAWYLRALLGKRILAATDSINLVLPLAFILASYMPGFLAFRLSTGIPFFSLVMWLAMAGSSAFLLMPVARDIHQYRRMLQNEFSSLKAIDPGWLQVMLLLMGALFALYAVLTVLMLHAPTDLPQRMILAALMAGFTTLLSWRSLGRKKLHPQGSRGEHGEPLPPDPEIRTQALSVKEQIEARKLYLEPELSLDDLAREVGLSRHQVSAVLNRGLSVSFFDLINQYRVREFQRLCRDDGHRGEKIITLAFDAGFNSKPTFNLIFKKATGQTPSQYRASVKIESHPNA